MKPLTQSSIALDALSQYLTAPPCTKEQIPTLLVTFPGQDSPLPIQVWRSRPPQQASGPLIILFCGAIDQTKRALPVFQRLQLAPFVADGGTVVAIADPSLRRGTEIKTAYYQGDDGCNTPRMIGELIETLIISLEPTRMVFTGNSAGAHAALFHAANRPDAVVITAAMIGHIKAHWSSMVEIYRFNCWPNLDLAEMSSEICMDVGPLYNHNEHPTVICLQNATDPHFCRQTAPFMSMIRDRMKAVLVSECLPSHTGHSYCKVRWAAWVTAATLASTTDVAAIVATYQDMIPGEVATAVKKPALAAVAKPSADAAAATADRIAHYLLEQS